MNIIEEILTGDVESAVRKEIEEVGIIDLAPYRVKNINNFYFRDHPKNLNPNTPKYKKYWYDFAVDAVEGKWVNDEGTWYWMPPKTFFLCNYLKIEDREKNPIFPHFRDLERIIGRYFVCADGFSGFDGDNEYTCNHLVKKFEEDGELEEIKWKKVTEDCYIKGTTKFKKYVDPWVYLMRHYLIDEKPSSPLGRAVYHNPVQNMMIMGGRYTSKSTYAFVADFIHEWFFCGVKRREDLDKTQRKRLFGMASTDSAAINRSLALISSVLTRLPGSYSFTEADGSNIPKFMGPYYKNYNGGWKIGSTVTHVEKDKNGTVTKLAAMAQMRVITPDKTKIFAGDRFGRIYIEEAGFAERLMEIHSNQKDTLQLFGNRVGSAVYLGTSGAIKAFRVVNELFTHPDTYDIQSIPNYWSPSSERGIGLFVPAYYTLRDYADENQNVDIVKTYAAKIKERALLRKTASAMAYDKEVMYHPVEPKEMIRPSGESVLPKQEAQEALNNIEALDIFKKRAMVGWLEYNKSYPNGVKFCIDLEGKKHPITTYSTKNLNNTEGAFIQYETPNFNAPKDMYWVLYDPAAQSGKGTSFHSVLVYKYSFAGNDNVLEDTIVAEWLGRLPTLNDNWNEVIKIAKYFNAKIFPEYNTPGFLDWCKDRKYFNLLQPENMNLKKELNPKAKYSAWRKGFRMDTRAKGWALNQFRDYLLEVREWDKDGVPIKRTIDTIYSTRLLEEIVSFDPDDGNYDHISSCLGLMILQNALRNIERPKQKDLYQDEMYIYRADDFEESVTAHTRLTRGKLSNSKLLNF